MAGRDDKGELTEKIKREDVKGTPVSAVIPGFASRVPARSLDEEDLPIIDGKDLLVGDPPEKEKKMTQEQEEMIKAAVAAAIAAVAEANKKPQKPPRPPIDWRKVWEKVEWMLSIVFFLFLYWVSQYRTVFFYLICICIAVVFAVKIREWFFSKEKDDNKGDKGDDEKGEKKEEGGVNWLPWAGLLLGAVLIAVIAFVLLRSTGVIGGEKITVVPVEKTTPAVIPSTEKKPVEVKVEKVAPATTVPQTDEEIEAVCLARPNTAAGLRCCTALFSEYETKEQRCKDKILGQMEKSN